MTTKFAQVNFNNLKSVMDAERKKAKLENQGYNLIKTNVVGFDKFSLIYRK